MVKGGGKDGHREGEAVAGRLVAGVDLAFLRKGLIGICTLDLKVLQEKAFKALDFGFDSCFVVSTAKEEKEGAVAAGT